MTVHHPIAAFEDKARIVAAPTLRNRGVRTFELHPAIHAMVIGAYFAFAGILSAAFMSKGLAIPAVIFAVGIASLFVTPALWARVQPKDDLPRQSWAEFRHEGVDCHTGALTSGQALAQIMLLPGLMVGLALVFAIIKATL